MGLSGRILVIGAAVVFGVAFFWVNGSIGSITGPNLQTASELNVPIFEPGDEESAVNRSENDVPEPILVPAPTQTSPAEVAEIVADPHTSEAGEIALREPLAEGAKKPVEATEEDGSSRGVSGSSASLPAETILPQSKSPLSDSTSFGFLPSEDILATSQDPALSTADPYAEETLLLTPPRTAPPDTPTSKEDTSAQPPPLEPMMDTVTSTLPSEPSVETTTSFPDDLSAGLPPYAEGTVDYE